MSFYRGWKSTPSDLHATAGQGARAVSSEYEHLRRARPGLVLLPRTVQWIASLPVRVRPRALADAFPRVANNIAAAWPDPVAFHAYLRELTEDRRGGRQGFPPDVARNLHSLWTYYAAAVQGLVEELDLRRGSSQD